MKKAHSSVNETKRPDIPNPPATNGNPSAQSDLSKKHRQNEEELAKKKEDSLDEGLEETFPASDPVSITPATPTRQSR